MRVGLMADTHDRLPAIAALVKEMQAANIGMVLHAGDYCSPFSLRPFEDAHISLAGVFGRAFVSEPMMRWLKMSTGRLKSRKAFSE